ncbi:4'-phosphopantetheinyl transferase superfamily protein [Herbiconiux sp. KACC 21604]|uniref:4'-phosphopantetheinyl transferase family protein n=1 Tax=unclassified Herbiconiux TaxID=2618217 RepID=UPI001492514A|nr:4'-phosphopantetheinyl transferase superfamily protein [Herbiconiux sp. SALV-R1]QJU52619.1 4'-phosphopantetheinyl transferase superfamily protein [Herbiconiux sp. SALV-R1]WPO87512.1 4'-phosphopantetheinyl transferase superfamily protein [Herbiconiux sp. KACC 21604]
MPAAPLPEVLVTFTPDRGDRHADHATLLALAARCAETPVARLEQRCPHCDSPDHGPLHVGAAPESAAPTSPDHAPLHVAPAAESAATSTPSHGPHHVAAAAESAAPSSPGHAPLHVAAAAESAARSSPGHAPLHVAAAADSAAPTSHDRGPLHIAAAPESAAPLVHVSLSRAGGWVALAATTVAPVGVDLESVAAARVAPFDDVAFTDDELRALATFPDHTADRMRTTAWTAKEAILKAHRTGLHTDPRHLTLDLAAPSPRADPDSEAPAIRLVRSSVPGVTPSATTLINLPTPAPTDLIATLALLRAPTPSIRITLL